MRLRPLFLICAMIVVTCVPATAQEKPAAQSDANQADVVAVLSATLRHMASAQEIFYSRNMRYAGEIDVLTSYDPVPGVTVRLVAIHPEFQGYAAEATHAALEGGNCVIFIGAEGTPEIATKREKKSQGMGRVACDSAG